MTDAVCRGEELLAVYPPMRPSITIEPLNVRLDPIRCLELQWGLAIPREGDCTSYGDYDVETSALDKLTEVVTVGPARVHGDECLELLRTEWAARSGWRPHVSRWYCRLGDERTEWVAVSREDGELFTHRDDEFDWHWGGVGPQRLVDDGRYIVGNDGLLSTTERTGVGAGVYRVVIGHRDFVCLRVLDSLGPATEQHELCEVFVSTSGRTVMYRQHRGRQMRYFKNQDPLERTPDERFPNNETVIVDGCVYVHADCSGRAHDQLTNTALGLGVTSGGARVARA